MLQNVNTLLQLFTHLIQHKKQRKDFSYLLNRNLSGQSPTKPTIISGNVSNVSGGYVLLGNIVFVSVFFKMQKAVSNDYLSVLQGMPVPVTPRAGLSAHGANQNPPHVQATVESTGFLRLFGTFAVGENIAVNGVYFK